MKCERIVPYAISAAIGRERDYQDAKYGPDRPHPIPSWLLIMRAELAEAEAAWMKRDDAEAMCEVLQVVAVGIAAIERHGVHERVKP